MFVIELQYWYPKDQQRAGIDQINLRLHPTSGYELCCSYCIQFRGFYLDQTNDNNHHAHSMETMDPGGQRPPSPTTRHQRHQSGLRGRRQRRPVLVLVVQLDCGLENWPVFHFVWIDCGARRWGICATADQRIEDISTAI